MKYLIKPSNQLKDGLVLALFFAAFYISVSVINDVVWNILGIAFLIAFLYGVVVLYKGRKIIFGN